MISDAEFVFGVSNRDLGFLTSWHVFFSAGRVDLQMVLLGSKLLPQDLHLAQLKPLRPYEAGASFHFLKLTMFLLMQRAGAVESYS